MPCARRLLPSGAPSPSKGPPRPLLYSTSPPSARAPGSSHAAAAAATSSSSPAAAAAAAGSSNAALTQLLRGDASAIDFAALCEAGLHFVKRDFFTDSNSRNERVAEGLHYVALHSLHPPPGHPRLKSPSPYSLTPPGSQKAAAAAAVAAAAAADGGAGGSSAAAPMQADSAAAAGAPAAAAAAAAAAVAAAGGGGAGAAGREATPPPGCHAADKTSTGKRQRDTRGADEQAPDQIMPPNIRIPTADEICLPDQEWGEGGRWIEMWDEAAALESRNMLMDHWHQWGRK